MSLEELIRHIARVHEIRVIAVEKTGYVDLQVMEVPEEHQGRGVGTRFMMDICAEADSLGTVIGLCSEGATPDLTERLESWYRRFGFVRNDDPERFRVTFARFPARPALAIG
jgi:GNAT superfamily N-acetyltransferase